MREEHRCTLALQPDVELQRAVGGLGDQRGVDVVRRAGQVDPGQLVPQQPPGEDRDLEVRRSVDDERETAVAVGATATPAAGRGVEQLDHAVAHRHPLPVEELADQTQGFGLSSGHELVLRPAHIHFSIFGRLFTQRLVTQMYFPGDPLFAYDPIFHAVRDPAARKLLVARFDLDATQPEWALAYEWDVVLGRGGRGTTPLEGGS